MCKGLTKAKEICKNSGKYNGYCHLHKNQDTGKDIEPKDDIKIIDLKDKEPKDIEPKDIEPKNIEPKDLKFIYFGSTMKKPYNALSNLHYHDGCEIEYQGKIYLTIEHIYQSRKFIPEDYDRFTINGDLSSYDALINYENVFYGHANYESKIRKLKHLVLMN